MNLLGAVLYDPTTAVTKGSAASALAAFDTTNARIAFTVPPSGRVRVVIEVTMHGATTFSQWMLGVLEGATVRGKVVPNVTLNGTALATTMCRVYAEFIVTGLTPGTALNWDAAWGCETFVASSLLKYGGPANATANNDFGALRFELWDPSPVYTPAAGAAPTSTLHVKVDAVQADTDDIQTRLPAALVSGRMDSSVGAMAANVLTAAAMDATASAEIADAVWDEAIAGHLTAGSTGEKLNAAGGAGDPWGTALPGAYGAGTAGNIIGNRLDVAVSTRGTGVALDAAGVRGAVGLAAANLDTQLDALPTAAETRAEIDANSTGLAAIFARTDVATSTRMATFAYTAPDNASITAIKAKTDSLTFTVAGKLDVNLLVVNGVTLQGTGTALDKWRAV